MKKSIFKNLKDQEELFVYIKLHQEEDALFDLFLQIKQISTLGEKCLIDWENSTKVSTLKGYVVAILLNK